MTVGLADPAEAVNAHDGGTPRLCGTAWSPVGVLLSMDGCSYHLWGLSLLSSAVRRGGTRRSGGSVPYSLNKKPSKVIRICREIGKANKKRSCFDPGSNEGPSDLQSDALPTELSKQLRVRCDKTLCSLLASLLGS